MDLKNPIYEIEKRAKSAGVNMSQLCVIAGIARSTPWRWKRGDSTPNYSALRKLEIALTGFEEKKANAK